MKDAARIKRATLVAHRAVERLDAEVAQALIDLYRGQATEIEARIQASAMQGETITLQELRGLLDQVNYILSRLTEQRDALLNGALSRAADYGSRPLLGEVSAAGAVIDTPASMTVSQEALRFVRTFIAQDGLQLSDRIWRIDRGARDRLVNALESAIIQGHGAQQAAREFLARGEGVPADVAGKLGSANAATLVKTARDIMTGEGSPMDNAMRLFRTEINRAHGEAYMMSGEDRPDFGGWRFLLSPSHPKPDICDLLSEQNLYGLGNGVYPTREACPWPAHPNTLSFVEIVFKDEITAADASGKETPMQALDRLSPAQRTGVLGKGKSAIYDDGQLTQGMIRAPLSAVRQRVDTLMGREPEFQWDAAKNRRNIEQRGLDFADAGLVFQGKTVTFVDSRQDYGERRWITMGQLDGRAVVIVHTRRDGVSRIISFRKANSREQDTYFNTD